MKNITSREDQIELVLAGDKMWIVCVRGFDKFAYLEAILSPFQDRLKRAKDFRITCSLYDLGEVLEKQWWSRMNAAERAGVWNPNDPDDQKETY